MNNRPKSECIKTERKKFNTTVNKVYVVIAKNKLTTYPIIQSKKRNSK